MMVKGGTLNEILFVPEPFRAADKAAIEQRRTAALAPALPPKSGPRKLMILVVRPRILLRRAAATA
jgi:hypothetical protein